MKHFAQGFAAAYLLAALYHCAIPAQPGVITPAGATPIVALAWPATLAPVFWRKFSPKVCEGGQHADR